MAFTKGCIRELLSCSCTIVVKDLFFLKVQITTMTHYKTNSCGFV
jgi:hypothetical protein